MLKGYFLSISLDYHLKKHTISRKLYKVMRKNCVCMNDLGRYSKEEISKWRGFSKTVFYELEAILQENDCSEVLEKIEENQRKLNPGENAKILFRNNANKQKTRLKNEYA